VLASILAGKGPPVRAFGPNCYWDALCLYATPDGVGGGS